MRRQHRVPQTSTARRQPVNIKQQTLNNATMGMLVHPPKLFPNTSVAMSLSLRWKFYSKSKTAEVISKTRQGAGAICAFRNSRCLSNLFDYFSNSSWTTVSDATNISHSLYRSCSVHILLKSNLLWVAFIKKRNFSDSSPLAHIPVHVSSHMHYLPVFDNLNSLQFSNQIFWF